MIPHYIGGDNFNFDHIDLQGSTPCSETIKTGE